MKSKSIELRKRWRAPVFIVYSGGGAVRRHNSSVLTKSGISSNLGITKTIYSDYFH